ncbi:DUF4276 family protein [Chryseobacterium gleum]|uniref:DUF4276 family protein n=1 Tax=Chryseobacterium gleum TaxID=250 RepID=UPI00241E1E7D|nr:DUF4276 family protein [Chryseobacterium gleum]
MRRLFIIVEGQTEKEFVEKSLKRYFLSHGIFDVRAIMIQTSKGHKGGFVNYEHLKNDIRRILDSESNVIVSTFVDFFKIPTNFPNFGEAKKAQHIDSKIELLYEGIVSDIDDERFIPYIQKHEFEALLFSSPIGFENWFDNQNMADELCAIVEKYNDPEEINTGIETAPSKRIINILEKHRQKYDKIAEGNLIAEEIGIDKILEKCPRFSNWTAVLIEKIKNN